MLPYVWFFLHHVFTLYLRHGNLESMRDMTDCRDSASVVIQLAEKGVGCEAYNVGTGKTIVALISAANVINSNYQVVLMAPTEILAKQHYEFAMKIFSLAQINIEILTGKTKENVKKKMNLAHVILI